MKCLTPPKIGVEGTDSTASGPSVCTSMNAPGARSTSEPGRNQLGRSVIGASVAPADETGAPRRRRTSTPAPMSASANVVTGTVNPVSTRGAVLRNNLRPVVVGGLFQFRPTYSKL